MATSAVLKLPVSRSVTTKRSPLRSSLISIMDDSVYRLLDVRRQLLAKFIRNGDRLELAAPHRDHNVISGSHDDFGIFLASNLEVDVDGAPSDFPEIGLHHEQLIEHHRLKEIALDMHARQTDAHLLEQVVVAQAAGAKQLRFGQTEKAEVGLVVDDAGGVDVLPPDVFFD